MRRAARTDANQTEIAESLTGCGCTVTSLAAVGKGVPDLLVGFRGRNVLLEIKDGAKVPSRRKLRDTQEEWHGWWRGQVAVVKNFDEAWAVVVAAQK